MNARPRRQPPKGKVSLARALSKLGFTSRSKAVELIQAGRVTVQGRTERRPEAWVNPEGDQISVDGNLIRRRENIYLMLNKPRGLVTTANDDQGRPTVFECFKNTSLPRIVPIGRLDQASEGLLLLTNDTRWVDRVAAPETKLEKVYHVQVNRITSEDDLAKIRKGVQDGADFLTVKSVALLRSGERNSWLEIHLDEGKNRHIRRLLAALEMQVLRLIRVAIGPLSLGNLEKGKFRFLSSAERARLQESF